MKLKGGDRRSIGRADEVAEEVAEEVAATPVLFEVVFNGMLSDDPLIRMRAADVVEKVTRNQPELLVPFKALLLNEVAASDQQEVRWHAAHMLPRLDLDEQERAAAIAVLKGYLGDQSRLARVNAMQALADLARQDDRLRRDIVPLLRQVAVAGSAAMRARGRKRPAVLCPEDDGYHNAVADAGLRRFTRRDVLDSRAAPT